MIQKTTWKNCLIFGINLIGIVFVLGCKPKEVDCLVKAKFIYVNQTNYNIETPIGIISPNSSLTKNNSSLGPCSISSESYVPPFVGDTKIIFDGNKCLTYNSISAGKGEGPVGINNYANEKLGNLYYQFTYTFTEFEYNQAEDCD